MFEHLRSLAVFAEVAEAGSFRKAADTLGVSHSVVSHHVSRMETSLGVSLLYRTTRKLSLTPDGERLLEAAKAMRNAAQSGLDEIAGRVSEQRGRLTVTVPATLSAGGLINDIAAFAEAHPRVELVLQFSDVRRDLIAEGIDVAIRMGRLPDSSLTARKLMSVPERAYAAPAYVARRPKARRPRDLETWDWLQLGRLHTRARFRNATGRVESITTRPRLRADDAVATYRLALAGLGVAMVPEFIAVADIAAGVIVDVLPGWAPAPIDVYAIWPGHIGKVSLARRFVDFITELERGRGAVARSAREMVPRREDR